MTMRRRGGPYDRPYRINRGGLIFHVSGRAGVRQTVIRILAQGRYKNDLLYRARGLGKQLREQIMRIYHRNLLRNTPIDTSRLRSSTRFRRNPARVTQGPTRGQGTSGYYGRFANRRSRRAGGFYERSASQTARQAQRTIERFRRMRRNITNIGQLATGRRLLRR